MTQTLTRPKYYQMALEVRLAEREPMLFHFRFASPETFYRIASGKMEEAIAHIKLASQDGEPFTFHLAGFLGHRGRVPLLSGLCDEVLLEYSERLDGCVSLYPLKNRTVQQVVGYDKSHLQRVFSPQTINLVELKGILDEHCIRRSAAD